MPYILNFVYFLILLVSAPWLIWSAVRKGKYRDGWGAKLFGAAPKLTKPDGPRLWFHAVSVGEVNLLAPLLREISAKQPDWECVISTTTSTGYALAKKKYPDLSVFYAPLDFSWAVARAMRCIQPTLLLLVELELWPNLIRAAKRQGAKVAIVNARLGARSFRSYLRVRWLTRRVLQSVDLVAAQTEDYADRFRALGADPDRIIVTGSLKFDGAQTDRYNTVTRRLSALAGFDSGDIIFLAGSTQAPEEALALKTFDALKEEHPRLKLVMVPRHPHRFNEVAVLLDRSGLDWQRRTTLVHGSRFKVQGAPLNVESETVNSEPRILLVDTIGELGAWWGAADIGFVGGSLGSRGGQNMIEPAAYGVATCFGPNTRNFRDIVSMLIAHEAAIVVSDGEQLTAFVRRCLVEPAFRAGLGQRACALVEKQVGATAATLGQLMALCDHCAPSNRAAKAA